MVEELARRTGVTVRSSAPTRVASSPTAVGAQRPGLREHKGSDELVKDLQSHGMKLSASAGCSTTRRLTPTFVRSAAPSRHSSTNVSGAMTTAERLQRRFEVDDDEAPAVLSKATEWAATGPRRRPRGRASPRLLDAGDARWTPSRRRPSALRVVEQLERHSQDSRRRTSTCFGPNGLRPVRRSRRPHDRGPMLSRAAARRGTHLAMRHRSAVSTQMPARDRRGLSRPSGDGHAPSGWTLGSAPSSDGREGLDLAGGEGPDELTIGPSDWFDASDLVTINFDGLTGSR